MCYKLILIVDNLSVCNLYHFFYLIYLHSVRFMPYGCHDSFLSLELTINDVVVFFQPHLYYNSTTHSVYRPDLKNFGQKHNMWYVGLIISPTDCYCELIHN